MSDKGGMVNSTDANVVLPQATLTAPDSQVQAPFNFIGINPVAIELDTNALPINAVARDQKQSQSVKKKNQSPQTGEESRSYIKKIELLKIEDVQEEPFDFDINTKLDKVKNKLVSNDQQLKEKIQHIEEDLIAQKIFLEEKKKEIREEKAGRNFFKYIFWCPYRNRYKQSISDLQANALTLEKDIAYTQRRLKYHRPAKLILEEKVAKLGTQAAESTLTEENLATHRAMLRKRCSFELHNIMLRFIANPKSSYDASTEVELNTANTFITICDHASDKIDQLLDLLQLQRRQIKSTACFIFRTKEQKQELKEICVQIQTTKKAILEIRAQREKWAKKARHEKFIAESDTHSYPYPLGDFFEQELSSLENDQKDVVSKFNRLVFDEIEYSRAQKQIPNKLRRMNKAWSQRLALDDNQDVALYVNERTKYDYERNVARDKLKQIPKQLEEIAQQKKITRKQLSQLDSTIKATKPLGKIEPKALAKAQLKYDYNALGTPFMPLFLGELPDAPCIEELKTLTNARTLLQGAISRSWDKKREQATELIRIKYLKEEAKKRWKVQRRYSCFWTRWRKPEQKEKYLRQREQYLQAMETAKTEKELAKQKLRKATIDIAKHNQQLSHCQIKHARMVKDYARAVVQENRKKISLSKKNAELVALLKPACDSLKLNLEPIERELWRLTAEKESILNPPSQTRARDIKQRLAVLIPESMKIKAQLNELYQLEIAEPTPEVINNAKALVQTIVLKLKAEERVKAHNRIESALSEATTALAELENIELPKQSTSADRPLSDFNQAFQKAIDKHIELKKALDELRALLLAQYKDIYNRAGWLNHKSEQREELSRIMLKIKELDSSLAKTMENINMLREKIKA